MSLGSWIIALILGVALILLAPLCPPPASRIVWIIGVILCVVAVVLFLLWLVSAVSSGAATAALLAV